MSFLPRIGLHHRAHEHRLGLCIRNFDPDHRAPRNRRKYPNRLGGEIHRDVVGNRLDFLHVDPLVEGDLVTGDPRTGNVSRHPAGNLETVERPLQDLARPGDRLRRFTDQIGTLAQHRNLRQNIFALPAADGRFRSLFHHSRADRGNPGGGGRLRTGGGRNGRSGKTLPFRLGSRIRGSDSGKQFRLRNFLIRFFGSRLRRGGTAFFPPGIQNAAYPAEHFIAPGKALVRFALVLLIELIFSGGFGFRFSWRRGESGRPAAAGRFSRILFP